ncbi:hypothetical protein [Mycolicibacterium arenosum]|uniref:PE family protein n=1 Tax=Mycolicibacterium arenosum TaxID=2952157 RepID=A0ABT1MCL0_9MYCO|nr:hypothetical protein [Mycolicibacterium sp. CAU 1645]MCP9276909.1 hypothetical protein [Mycolicibacterium sp. CAU 1645]
MGIGGLTQMETVGVLATQGASAGLAAEAVGHGAQAMAAGVVLPPGLDEISAYNVGRILAYAEQLGATLEGSAAIEAAYGVANGTSSVITSLTDALNAAGINGLI